MTQLNTTSLYAALNQTVHSTLANTCVKICDTCREIGLPFRHAHTTFYEQPN